MKLPNVTLMQRFALRLFVLDVLIAATTLLAMAFIHFRDSEDASAILTTNDRFTISLTPVALAISMFIVWVVALAVAKSWNARIAGTGIAEYLMTTKASVAVVLFLAFASLIFKVDVSRTFVFSAFALGASALIVHRWLCRQWLLRQRGQGRYIKRTLLVGPPEQMFELADRLKLNALEGYVPVRAAVFANVFSQKLHAEFARQGIELVTFEDSVAEDIEQFKIDSVIIIGSDQLSSERLKQLGWSLEGTNAELIVAPALVDFAGTRINSHPVAGMPFLHVETPSFEGIKYLAKTTFDLIFAVVAFVVVLPIMVVTAIAVWCEDRGPIFYAQERIGQNGKPFKMFKFRSMIVNAESMHATLRKNATNLLNEKMFKDPNDPRLTKVGRFIRRYSIDELPQIFNVMNGSMSVVGPRPPLAVEVAEYEIKAHRRLLVKPGITGLWQVSGRSLLSWDETVRLDLYYVENWSLAGDIFIILRTFRVVAGRTGAY
ncbi:MAG: hypothetical protein RL196_1285 [Actinomycetota bacterium]|jgi:exopolysaccharide biosynthesis polyprenyl glycosylphosphotransferase